MRRQRLLPLLVLTAIAMPAGGRLCAAGPWAKLSEGVVGRRTGAVLVPIVPAGKMLYFGGEGDAGGAYVRALDAKAGTWSDFAKAKPEARRGIHPSYQAAYDPAGRKLYCLTYPGLLYTFDVAAKKWAGPASVPELEGLSWHTMAIDPAGRKLVVVGADKRPDNVGWTRTVLCDLATGTWAPLALPPAAVVAKHRQLVAAWEAAGELVGRVRLAWYRDPAGRGTDAERKALAARCAGVRKLPGAAAFSGDVEAIASRLAAGKLLEALQAARRLHGRLDEAAVAQYPVPASRRNAPLAFDPASKLFVLFGGDHEDYLMNDTWLLDLRAGAWRRGKCDLAPSPRAGHALVALPKSGRIALYEGYVTNRSCDYGVGSTRVVSPRQLWLYDARADRWDLAGTWNARGGAAEIPPPTGRFHGYHGQYFAAPALAADADDRLILPASSARGGGATWTLAVNASKPDAAGRAKLGRAANERLRRGGRFQAAYCEVPDAPKPTKLDALPANRWVRLPDPPRNVAYGYRQRDWGTAVWDQAHEQILLWGGGHCVGSSSSVIHYSPLSGRMVESYDADEPHNRNGNGGYDSSLLNRPWVGVHSYNTYAFDPPTGRMVSARGYFYDPVRMDWLRRGPIVRPFRYVWGHTVLEATPHGAVAWAQDAKSERIGLWRYDKAAGWVDLKPIGKLYSPYCDSEGMVYDTKRDRLVLGWGGGYNRAGDGALTTFDFATRKIAKHLPDAAELGRIRNTREMAYVDSADWIAFAEPFFQGDRKAARHYLRIYDCAKRRYFLLDAGNGPSRTYKVHGQGWCWDAKRKLLYVITIRGGIWALRFDPAAAKLIDAPPGPKAKGPLEKLGESL